MANKPRLIDANALADNVDTSKYDNPHTNGRVRINHITEHDHFLRMIYDAPTVDAAEVVHGRWEEYPDSAHLRCTNCKMEFRRAKMSDTRNYCPNCGAKMDGERGTNGGNE